MVKRLFLILILISSHVAHAKRVTMLHMGRSFTLVSPDDSQIKKRPLLVLLHGCLQDPSMILAGTGLETEALKNNFYILAPAQSSFHNSDNCWNWFFAHEQVRFPMNEMGQIVSAVDIVTNSLKVDRNHIYVAGLSAGGALAHNLMSCYPDVFSGGAIHSGVNFKAAENILEARPILTARRQKSPDYLAQKMIKCSFFSANRVQKLMIIQGDLDKSVAPLHAELISRTVTLWRDYLDDGMKNDSDRGLISSENIKFTNGFEVEKTDTVYTGFIERKLKVKGLAHAWGGGKAVSVHFDPKAPSSSKFILDFFGLVK